MFADAKAWGYVIAVLIMVFSGAAMLLKIISFEQFMIAEGAAVAILGITSTVRATARADAARVKKAVDAGECESCTGGKP